MKITISVCTYQNSDFDVIIQDPDTGEEVTLSGVQKISDEEHEVLNKLAPACVFTTYERKDE